MSTLKFVSGCAHGALLVVSAAIIVLPAARTPMALGVVSTLLMVAAGTSVVRGWRSGLLRLSIGQMYEGFRSGKLTTERGLGPAWESAAFLLGLAALLLPS